MQDKTYSVAISAILKDLNSRKRPTLSDLVALSGSRKIPSETVRECIDYLSAEGIVRMRREPSGSMVVEITDRERAMNLVEDHVQDTPRLVLSLPSFDKFGLAEDLDAGNLDFLETSDTFKMILDSAQTEILICSPFAQYNGLSLFTQTLKERLVNGCYVMLLCRQIGPDDFESRHRDIMKFIESLDLKTSRARRIGIRNYHFSEKIHVKSSAHAKFIVADSSVAYIGSADVRLNSFQKNLEVGILVHGEIARGLRKIFLAMYKDSIPIFEGDQVGKVL